MAVRLLKVSLLATTVFAASGFYLYNNYVDPNDISIVRFGRAAITTAVISYDYLTSLKTVPYGTEDYWAVKSKVHLRSAERLKDLCCANRGTFIKVGQHLGALDYLLPEEYTSTLKILHSRAPQSSLREIEQVIREDLGKEIAQLFVSFEESPQGAASLAQVHKAVLHDGRTVAVKVQHPKVQTQSSKDILVIEFLLKTVTWLFPDFGFMWLIEEAKKNMPLELDFLNEGRNAERVANMLKHFEFLKVPKIHWDLSTKRILTMEFVEGGQVNDLEYMKENCIDVNEDVEIRTNAALYLPQISELLNKVPREMLLLLKTNDLLRGIETTLQTRASASSFFNMSRCCIRAIAKYQKKRSRSRYKKMQISFSEAFTLWQINLYELLLWIRGSTLGNWIVSFLNCIHYVH
ncbi:aarF domain-containing protein kinase 1-like isoform X2 [Acipenser ruthenus]|uniref:aarF domain-containing protein kinase 1-like isoform X2 n=1 Tax=Acipenser ruthenus TaxID=7906 RepID=UPI002741C1CF|nr:aarF domain-containing protein kinase 1-like isoform X2 [Acipenser ruthenus]XP_058847747.1 aarF domain-containing protein kinase 1-like isoform X2 [Acipenser ruthenus]